MGNHECDKNKMRNRRNASFTDVEVMSTILEKNRDERINKGCESERSWQTREIFVLLGNSDKEHLKTRVLALSVSLYHTNWAHLPDRRYSDQYIQPESNRFVLSHLLCSSQHSPLNSLYRLTAISPRVHQNVTNTNGREPLGPTGHHPLLRSPQAPNPVPMQQNRPIHLRHIQHP